MAELERKRGRECSAVFCKNQRYRDSDFSFHLFPSAVNDPERRKQWIVNLKRANPEKPGELWEPGKDDHVCSKHFKKDSFELFSRLMNEQGKKTKWILVPDAVPTEFPDRPTEVSTLPLKKRSAYAKRRRIEVRTEQSLF